MVLAAGTGDGGIRYIWTLLLFGMWEYNSQTRVFQILLLFLLAAGLLLSYTHKCKWAAKLVLGAANLFIGIVFFGVFGTEAIQKFFALPLYRVLSKAMELCEAQTGSCSWPDIPDTCWEQAVQLLLGKTGSLALSHGTRFAGT